MKKAKKWPAVYPAFQNVNKTQGFAPAQTLHLGFRNAPLRIVLDYIGKMTGLIIEVKPNVVVNNLIDVYSDRPLNNHEALGLLEQTLHKQGCTIIQNGRWIAIMRTEDAKKTYIPIRFDRSYQGIRNGPASSRSLFSQVASLCSN